LVSGATSASVFTAAFGAASATDGVVVAAGDREVCRAGLALAGLTVGRSASDGVDDDESTAAADAAADVGVFSSLDAARRPRMSDFQRIFTASSVRPYKANKITSVELWCARQRFC
jgi:hypothetical protein